MILILHIIIALSSLAATTWLAIWPSKRKMYFSYALIALTLASGTYLVISLHSPLLSSCVSGLTYLALALSGVVVGYYRLARQEQEN